MRRTVLILLVVSVAAANLSFATVTRTKTMGRIGHWVSDDSNIFYWPSTLVNFSDRFLLEFGEGTSTGGYNPVLVGPTFPVGFGGGVVVALKEKHHLGFYVSGNDRSNGGGTIDAFFPQGLSLDDFATFFYGYKMESLDIGLNVNYGKSRGEQTAPSASAMKQSVGENRRSGGDHVSF